MQTSPPPFVFASPDEKNILVWNYIIRGPPDCPYAGGEYHGVLLFPSEYPFKPPGIKMFTPSGRFQPDKKICFSMSDFHPGTWNPAWSVATILTGLLSFMLSDEMTTGSVTSAERDKRILASRSHEWNKKQKRFIDAFPEYCGDQMKELPNMGERDRGTPSSTAVNGNTSTPPATSIASQAKAIPIAPPRPNMNHPPQQPLNPSQIGSDNGTSAVASSPAAAGAGEPTPPPGWAASWKDAMWNKWRWGILIAFAVMVSRLSSL